MNITDFPITEGVWAGLLYRNDPHINALFVNHYQTLTKSHLSDTEKKGLKNNLRYACDTLRKEIKSRVKGVSDTVTIDVSDIDKGAYDRHLHHIVALKTKDFYFIWNTLHESARQAVIDFYFGWATEWTEHPLVDMLAVQNYQGHLKIYKEHIKNYQKAYAIRLGLLESSELDDPGLLPALHGVKRHDVGFPKTVKWFTRRKLPFSEAMAVDAVSNLKKINHLPTILPYILHDGAVNGVIQTLFGKTLYTKKDITYENIEILADIFRRYPNEVYQHTGRLNRDLLMVLELYTQKVHKKALEYFANNGWSNIGKEKLRALDIDWRAVQSGDYLFGLSAMKNFSPVPWPEDTEQITIQEQPLIW